MSFAVSTSINIRSEKKTHEGNDDAKTYKIPLNGTRAATAKWKEYELQACAQRVNLFAFESCRLQITYNLNRLLASFRYYLFVW